MNFSGFTGLKCLENIENNEFWGFFFNDWNFMIFHRFRHFFLRISALQSQIRSYNQQFVLLCLIQLWKRFISPLTWHFENENEIEKWIMQSLTIWDVQCSVFSVFIEHMDEILQLIINSYLMSYLNIFHICFSHFFHFFSIHSILLPHSFAIFFSRSHRSTLQILVSSFICSCNITQHSTIINNVKRMERYGSNHGCHCLF